MMDPDLKEKLSRQFSDGSKSKPKLNRREKRQIKRSIAQIAAKLVTYSLDGLSRDEAKELAADLLRVGAEILESID